MKSFAPLLLLTLLAACQQSRKLPDNFDYGKVENNIYSNKYLDFQIPVPANWVVQTKEQTEKIKQEGNKMIGEKNKKLAEEVKANDVTSAVLLSVFKNKTDSVTSEFNSSFIFVAENLRGISSVKTGADYLERTKSLMNQSGMTYQFPNAIHAEKLGNKDFDLMEAVTTVQGVNVHQYYYATIQNGFALSVVVSFGTPEQKNELKNILNGLKFQ